MSCQSRCCFISKPTKSVLRWWLHTAEYVNYFGGVLVLISCHAKNCMFHITIRSPHKWILLNPSCMLCLFVTFFSKKKIKKQVTAKITVDFFYFFLFCSTQSRHEPSSALPVIQLQCGLLIINRCTSEVVIGRSSFKGRDISMKR